MPSGVQTLTTLTGTEKVIVDNGGAVFTQAAVSLIAGTAGGGAATSTFASTQAINLNASGTPFTASIPTLQNVIAGGTFTTSAQSNSTSVTLSAQFTALTYTQTSTGNTVHLKAAPVDGEVQRFSVTNIVTNLTVSAAANTVTGGAIGTTVAGQSFAWLFMAAGTTWYRYQ